MGQALTREKSRLPQAASRRERSNLAADRGTARRRWRLNWPRQRFSRCSDIPVTASNALGQVLRHQRSRSAVCLRSSFGRDADSDRHTVFLLDYFHPMLTEVEQGKTWLQVFQTDSAADLILVCF